MNKELIIGILINLVAVGIIISVFFVTLEASGGSINRFKEKCESFNGNFYLLENVTCKSGYPMCFVWCEFDNDIRANYYDNVCAKSCESINKGFNLKEGETRCVC